MRSIRITTSLLLLALAIGVITALPPKEQQGAEPKCSVCRTNIEERKIPAPEANCNSKTCYDSCRRKGFRNGYCDHNICQCTQPVAFDQLSARQVNSEDKVLHCYANDCNAHCVRLGSTSGYCAEQNCQCQVKRKLVKHLDEPIKSVQQVGPVKVANVEPEAKPEPRIVL